MISAEKAKTRKLISNPRKRSRTIFYICIMALPVLQFVIFYIFVNLNSFILAFKEFTDEYGLVSRLAGFKNFVWAWKNFSGNLYMLRNSLLQFLFTTAIGLTLAIIFSYYIYKKFFGASFFKFALFMPQIISSVVFVVLFKYLVTNVYKVLSGAELGLLDNDKTRLATVLFYNVWVSFGINVILFSGSMNEINTSIIESAQLDGANYVQELWHIVLPMIWPTLTQFTVVGVSAIFTNQMNLFSFLSRGGLDVASFGYYFYIQTLESTSSGSMLNYPQLSALGLLLTLIIMPVTILVRKCMEKFGPKEY